jgi:predicted naringenin-chalcone synthase
MKIETIKTHYPGRSYSNAELVDMLRSRDMELSETLVQLGGKHFSEQILASDEFFSNLGVEARNILSSPVDPMSWWEKNAGSDPFALEAAKAYEKLMKDKEPLLANDRIILIANGVDTVSPHIGYAMLGHLQMRNERFIQPSVISMVGEGCSGFISGLREADIYLRATPNTRVVIITVEMMATPLHNPWLQPGLIAFAKTAKGHQITLLRKQLTGLGIQRYLFGEGCAAALCTLNGKGIKFSNFYKWANLVPEDRHLLELVATNTKKLPHLPPFGFFKQQPKRLFKRLMESYLPAAYTEISKMSSPPKHFAIHTGSGKILNYIQQAFAMPDEAIEPSRYILRTQGNMNATTGAAILAKFQQDSRTQDVLALFFGVGFALQLAY